MPSNLGQKRNADWNCSDPLSNGYINNKPVITAYTQQNSDWNSTTNPTRFTTSQPTQIQLERLAHQVLQGLMAQNAM